MIPDIWSVMWKEWHELLVAQRTGTGRGGWLNLAIILLVFGILLPVQSGRAWLESPVVLIYWGWVPLFLVSGVIADSFAGERERHTLETLLASRLPDRAILLGKVATAAGYGWGLTMVSLVLGLVAVNVTTVQGPFVLYPPTVLWGGPVLCLLAALTAAGAGVFVSLRAASVRQAAQTLNLAIMILIFVPVFGLQALPDAIKAQLLGGVLRLDATTAVPVALVALLLMDVLLLMAALARFQRSRLILD